MGASLSIIFTTRRCRDGTNCTEWIADNFRTLFKLPFSAVGGDYGGEAAQ